MKQVGEMTSTAGDLTDGFAPAPGSIKIPSPD